MTEPDASLSGEEARLMKALSISASREKDPNAGTAKKAAEKAIVRSSRRLALNLIVLSCCRR